MSLPAIDPMPPHIAGLPMIGAAIPLLRNPTEFFRHQRARHGDTFVVDIFGYRLFCVFSAAGVRQLYGFAEHQASFGRATYELVLKHKVPLELIAGRRNFPHTLFGKEEVEDYLEALEDAMRLQIDELGASGSFDVFAVARRLGYRLGLAAWAGREAASRPHLDQLIPMFDRLDAGDSFVRPLATMFTYFTGKVRERRAMRGIEEILGQILEERRARGAVRGDFLDRIYESFADLAPNERRINTARDIMMIQMGAQSNLYAALAWTLIHLLQHPAYLERVRAGDETLLEQCTNESIRLAQRSLTLRQVVVPLQVETEQGTFNLAPGVMIATMLPLNNVGAASGLEEFDPQHFSAGKLQVELEAKELVSTFGHGRHACPAQRFSISAIRIAVRSLLDRYDLTPQFAEVVPRARQIGGVARPSGPCLVRYQARL